MFVLLFCSVVVYVDMFDDIKSCGKMIVVIDFIFVFYEYIDVFNVIVGYYLVVLVVVVKSLGVKIEYQCMVFSGIIFGLLLCFFDMEGLVLNVIVECVKCIVYVVFIGKIVNGVLVCDDFIRIFVKLMLELLVGLIGVVKIGSVLEGIFKQFNEMFKFKGLVLISLFSVDSVDQMVVVLMICCVDFVFDDVMVLVDVIKQNLGKMKIIGELGFF